MAKKKAKAKKAPIVKVYEKCPECGGHCKVTSSEYEPNNGHMICHKCGLSATIDLSKDN